MPYGGTTPEQDKKIERCVADVMPTLAGKYKDPKERKSHAIAICKSRISGKKEGTDMKIYETPVRAKWIESFTADLDGQSADEVKIHGTAIKATTSRNGVTYEMQELENAASTLKGQAIGLNHKEDVTDNIGIIDNVLITPEGLDYEGRAFNTGKHPYVIELLRKGLIRFVSIEALVDTMVEEGATKKAKGLQFTGMDFVKTPGIEGAYTSIAEALEHIEQPTAIIKEESAGEKMAEEIKPVEESKEPVKETTEVKTIVVEKVDGEKLAALEKDISTFKEEIKEVIESMKPSTKGVVSEETTEKKITEDFVFKKEKEGMSVYAKYPEDLY